MARDIHRKIHGSNVSSQRPALLRTPPAKCQILNLSDIELLLFLDLKRLPDYVGLTYKRLHSSKDYFLLLLTARSRSGYK